LCSRTFLALGTVWPEAEAAFVPIETWTQVTTSKALEYRNPGARVARTRRSRRQAVSSGHRGLERSNPGGDFRSLGRRLRFPGSSTLQPR
jgi:hypothetical protein